MIGVKNSPISVGGTVGSFSTRFLEFSLIIPTACSTLSSFVPIKNVVFPFFKNPPVVDNFVTKYPSSVSAACTDELSSEFTIAIINLISHPSCIFIFYTK